MIEKYGFSVVAAIRVTQRFSTAGSSESCWALLKRWISSRKSTSPAGHPAGRRGALDDRRTSLTPAVIADSSTNARCRSPTNHVREGGLAGAGRAPEDHRGRCREPPRPRRPAGAAGTRRRAGGAARRPRPGCADASARRAVPARPQCRRPPPRRGPRDDRSPQDATISPRVSTMRHPRPPHIHPKRCSHGHAAALSPVNGPRTSAQ